MLGEGSRAGAGPGEQAALGGSDTALRGGVSCRSEDASGSVAAATQGVPYRIAVYLHLCFLPIYYLTGHSTPNQAEIDVASALRRNLDLHAQSLVLETSLTSTLAASPVSLLYATFSL